MILMKFLLRLFTLEQLFLGFYVCLAISVVNDFLLYTLFCDEDRLLWCANFLLFCGGFWMERKNRTFKRVESSWEEVWSLVHVSLGIGVC